LSGRFQHYFKETPTYPYYEKPRSRKKRPSVKLRSALTAWPEVAGISWKILKDPKIILSEFGSKAGGGAFYRKRPRFQKKLEAEFETSSGKCCQPIRGGNVMKILIVDDNAVSRKVMKAMCTRFGYKTWRLATVLKDGFV